MPSPDLEVYRALDDAFRELGAAWYVFGGQAAILHGAHRFTEDLDVTVLPMDIETQELVRVVTRRGFSLRVPDIDGFVAQTRVLPILHAATKIPVDVVLGGPGLEQLFAQRAQLLDVGGLAVPVASAEDLIVMKVLAGRRKDLEDAVAILMARGAKLDLAQVKETIRIVEQALDQSDLTPLLEQCLQQAKTV